MKENNGSTFFQKELEHAESAGKKGLDQTTPKIKQKCSVDRVQYTQLAFRAAFAAISNSS